MSGENEDDSIQDEDTPRVSDLILPTPKTQSPRNPNHRRTYPKSRGNIYTSTVRDNLVKDETFGAKSGRTVQDNGKRKRSSINKTQVGIFMVVFVVIMVQMGPSLLKLLTSNERTPTERAGYNPLHPQNLQKTALVQATLAASNYATRSAATKIAVLNAPTLTPLQVLLSSADEQVRYYNNYIGAHDLYTQALAIESQNSDIYFLRGQAGTKIGTEQALLQAVEDFTAVIVLDSRYKSAYSERANARYLLWQMSDDPTLPDLIRQDISDYRKNGGIVTQKMDIMLNFLP